MSAKIWAEADRVKRIIDEACEPPKMSPRQAVDFLERLADHCESAVEALREENEI